MSPAIRGFGNPDLWRVRGKMLGLRAAIDESRSVRFQSGQQRLLREYTRLCSRWRELLADGLVVKEMSDPAATHRLAKEIATFYQQLGSFEGRLDSMLAEARATEPRVCQQTG